MLTVQKKELREIAEYLQKATAAAMLFQPNDYTPEAADAQAQFVTALAAFRTVVTAETTIALLDELDEAHRDVVRQRGTSHALLIQARDYYQKLIHEVPPEVLIAIAEEKKRADEANARAAAAIKLMSETGFAVEKKRILDIVDTMISEYDHLDGPHGALCLLREKIVALQGETP